MPMEIVCSGVVVGGGGKVVGRTATGTQLDDRDQEVSRKEDMGSALGLAVYRVRTDKEGKVVKREAVKLGRFGADDEDDYTGGEHGKKGERETQQQQQREQREQQQQHNRQQPRRPQMVGRKEAFPHSRRSRGLRLFAEEAAKGSIRRVQVSTGAPLAGMAKERDVLEDLPVGQHKSKVRTAEDGERCLSLLQAMGISLFSADGQVQQKKTSSSNKRPGSASTTRSGGSQESTMSGQSSCSFMSGTSGMSRASRISQRKSRKKEKQDKLHSLTRKSTKDYLEAVPVRTGDDERLAAKIDAWIAEKNGETTLLEAESTPEVVKLEIKRTTIHSLKARAAKSRETANFVGKKLEGTIMEVRNWPKKLDVDLKTTLDRRRRDWDRDMELKYSCLVPGAQSANAKYAQLPPTMPTALQGAREAAKWALNQQNVEQLPVVSADQDDDESSAVNSQNMDGGDVFYRDAKVEVAAMRHRVRAKKRAALRQAVANHQRLKPALKKVSKDVKRRGGLRPCLVRFLGGLHRILSTGRALDPPAFFQLLAYAFIEPTDWKLKIVEILIHASRDQAGVPHDDLVSYVKSRNIQCSAALLKPPRFKGHRGPSVQGSSSSSSPMMMMMSGGGSSLGNSSSASSAGGGGSSSVVQASSRPKNNPEMTSLLPQPSSSHMLPGSSMMMMNKRKEETSMSMMKKDLPRQHQTTTTLLRASRAPLGGMAAFAEEDEEEDA